MPYNRSLSLRTRALSALACSFPSHVMPYTILSALHTYTSDRRGSRARRGFLIDVATAAVQLCANRRTVQYAQTSPLSATAPQPTHSAATTFTASRRDTNISCASNFDRTPQFDTLTSNTANRDPVPHFTMAVPIYDHDDQTDSCSNATASATTSKTKLGELSPMTAKCVQYYIDTQQHQLGHQQLAALKAWRTKYLQSLQSQAKK